MFLVHKPDIIDNWHAKLKAIALLLLLDCCRYNKAQNSQMDQVSPVFEDIGRPLVEILGCSMAE